MHVVGPAPALIRPALSGRIHFHVDAADNAWCNSGRKIPAEKSLFATICRASGSAFPGASRSKWKWQRG